MGAVLDKVLTGLGPVWAPPTLGCGPAPSLRPLEILASETMTSFQPVEPGCQPLVALCWNCVRFLAHLSPSVVLVLFPSDT